MAKDLTVNLVRKAYKLIDALSMNDDVAKRAGDVCRPLCCSYMQRSVSVSLNNSVSLLKGSISLFRIEDRVVRNSPAMEGALHRSRSHSARPTPPAPAQSVGWPPHPCSCPRRHGQSRAAHFTCGRTRCGLAGSPPCRALRHGTTLPRPPVTDARPQSRRASAPLKQ